MVKTKFIYTLTYVNEQLYSTSNSESDSEDVAERLALLMKLDDDNLAVKTTSSCSAAEQPPVDSGKVQNNASVVLTKIVWPSRPIAHLLGPVKK